MAIRVFEVTKYQFALSDKKQSFGGITVTVRGLMWCTGIGADRIAVSFLMPGSPVPAASLTVDGNGVELYLPVDLMPLWVDLLRNEKPVYGIIDTAKPEQSMVGTITEPVGEGES